jgi:hypothetical protein
MPSEQPLRLDFWGLPALLVVHQFQRKSALAADAPRNAAHTAIISFFILIIPFLSF